MAGSRWGDLRTRVISAAVLGPMVLGCIALGGTPFAVMVLGAAIGMAWEWVALCGALAPGLAGLSMIVAVAAAVGCAMSGQAGAGLACLAAGTVATGLVSRDLPHGRTLAAGVPYIGLGVVALLWVRADDQAGLINLLFLLLLVWCSDIGAYLTGRFVGGPRLAPSISPGKTWSGAIGGLLGAMIAALAVARAGSAAIEPGRVCVIAAGLGVMAQSGDLLESLIKRHFGVKDSSQIIPGHGGLLDRLDALLFAAPIAAMLALMAGRGVKIWQ